jgi:hypothetical protein
LPGASPLTSPTVSPDVKAVLWTVIFLDVYVLIYYRLLIKHHYQRAHGVNEGTFWILLCLPPYARLPAAGKKYVHRYWVALGILIGCVIALAMTADFSRLGT